MIYLPRFTIKSQPQVNIPHMYDMDWSVFQYKKSLPNEKQHGISSAEASVKPQMEMFFKIKSRT